MQRTALLMIGVLAVGLGACLLQDPDYEGTAFSCSEPDGVCPSGFACVQGTCQPEDGLPDAGPGTERDEPDADVDSPADDPNDDPNDDPDDDPPDAGMLPDPTTVSFGERNGADRSGVTTDTALQQEHPFLENGGDDEVAIDADPVKYGLLRFDLSSIPANATIVSAELDLYVRDPNEDGDLVGYQLLEDWEEDEANYIYRRDNQKWTAAGAGTGSASASPAVTFTPRMIGFYQVDLPAALVQGWVATPSSNHGIVWRSNSQGGRGGEIVSSEGDADYRPLLRVTYR